MAVSKHAAALRAGAIWAGAIGIGVAGATLQSVYGCGFFGRSGAVIAAYGLLLGFITGQRTSRHAEILDSLQSDQVRLAHLMHLRSNSAPPELHEQIDDMIERKVIELDKTVESLSADARQSWRLRLVELPIVLIGTLIWGFGDLLQRAPGCALTD